MSGRLFYCLKSVRKRITRKVEVNCHKTRYLDMDIIDNVAYLLEQVIKGGNRHNKNSR